MGQSLTEIAQALRDTDKKVQLIYAFNGTGKTRLSREFKELVSPKETETEDDVNSSVKILYYNAFTEDLFYWDNDLDADSDRKLKLQPNNFTDWVLRDQGQESNLISHFQHYTSNKLTPRFNQQYTLRDKDGKDVTININDQYVDNGIDAEYCFKFIKYKCIKIKNIDIIVKYIYVCIDCLYRL